VESETTPSDRARLGRCDIQLPNSLKFQKQLAVFRFADALVIYALGKITFQCPGQARSSSLNTLRLCVFVVVQNLCPLRGRRSAVHLWLKIVLFRFPEPKLFPGSCRINGSSLKLPNLGLAIRGTRQC
jgi:hypothetical protein